MQSCSAGRAALLPIEGQQWQLPKAAFDGAEGKRPRRWVVAHHSTLPFDAVVYRSETDEYRALLLRCTHQGATLSVHGDLIVCAAHGSEFDAVGAVVQGPASQPLEAIKTTTDQHHIYLHLP